MTDYKILFLGAPGAGKTALVKKFDTDTFDDEEYNQEYATTEVSAGSSKVPVKLCHNATVDNLSDSGVVGIVFVFDVTSQESFDALAPIVAKMEEILPEAAAAMCANKVEDDNADSRVVTFLGCKEIYAAKIPVFETSAKTGKNVKTVIQQLGMLAGADITPPEPEVTGNESGGSAKSEVCCNLQ